MKKGSKQSPEAIEKMRLAKLGKKDPPETIEKKRLAQLNPETLERNRNAHLGKTASLDTRNRLKITNGGENNGFFGKHHSEETLAKITGRPKSEEHCKKLREVKKGIIPPNIEIFKTSRLGATNSEYQRARVKESNTGLVRSEETKQLIRQNRAGVCTGSDNGAWNGGTSYFPYCPKFNEPRKRAVRNFFDNKCLTCGKPASENYRGQKVIALSVHHIHHNKTEGCHGIPFNLVPLCFDCHNEEQFKQEEYKTKINQILDGGFASGRWSRVAYEREVMYPE